MGGPGGFGKGPANPQAPQRTKMDKKTARGVLFRLCGYVIKYWYLFIPAILMTLLSNQLSLLGPKYSGIAIDAIANPDGVQFDIVSENIVKMIFCYGFSAILSYILASLMIFMGQKIVFTMRKQVFEKALRKKHLTKSRPIPIRNPLQRHAPESDCRSETPNTQAIKG